MSTPPAKEEEIVPKVPINFRKVVMNEILSRSSVVAIDNIDEEDFFVRNTKGNKWSIKKPIVGEDGFVSAVQYDESNVQFLSRTRIVKIMADAGSRVFTVKYNLALKPEDFIEIVRKKDGKFKANEELISDFKKVKGKERILTGRLLTTEQQFGRFLVEDLRIVLFREGAKDEKDKGIRLVDTSTINELILDGILFKVGK